MVIDDVSGDGKQNIDLLGLGGDADCGSSGDAACNAVVNAQRNAAEAAGITVNALAIVDDSDDLRMWFEDNVITSGGFALETTFETFALAVTDKIGREIAPIPIPAALPLFGSALAALGLIGWRRRIN